VLLLAADLPYLVVADLDLLLAEEAPVVIAPDRHLRGTNALLLAPPLAIAPAFGDDSFRAHTELARIAGLDLKVVTSRGLATDIDDPDDLRLLLGEAGVGQKTRELLASAAFSTALAR
jgi:2-phospho-L-lactate guanylyltransferase